MQESGIHKLDSGIYVKKSLSGVHIPPSLSQKILKWYYLLQMINTTVLEAMKLYYKTK